MKLTQADTANPLWGKLSKHMEARLAEKRKALEADKDERTTAKLRGSIHELKEFLALAQFEPAPEPATDDQGE